MLNKAIKYNINLDEKKKIIVEDLIDFETAIRMKDSNIQDPIRYSFVHELNKLQSTTNKSNVKERLKEI